MKENTEMKEDIEKKIWLSQEAYNKLEDELKFLSTAKRDEIKQKIAQARSEGDLKENGGYHAAREEQGKNEGRIREIEYKLANSKITLVSSTETVQAGSLITAKIDSQNSKFVLGSREIKSTLNDSTIDVYSPTSPIGQAVINAKKGQIVKYTAPSGKQIKIEILKISAI
ncbi:MAG: transcription elongation factor GreA [Bifidobacteriaceae bacterium]|jgi:transcription elongation factor GreA|nr:transcription elongation factor GreA [Bifidobacteriaceae bacterium]